MENQNFTSTQQPRPWQAYGLTSAQLAELQRMQINGNAPMIKANNVEPGDFTNEAFRLRYAGYRIPAADQMFYHVALRRVSYNQMTGEDESSFVVQTYNVETFQAMTNREAFGGTVDGFHGMQTHVLHDPTRKTTERK